MRTIVVAALTFALGCGAGWYFGYTRPVARNSWRVSRITGWDPRRVSDAFNDPDETFRKIFGAGEEQVAITSLRAFTWLELGQSDRAKDFLAQRLADYYINDYKLEAPSPLRDQFRHRIEEVSKNSPTLKKAIEARRNEK